MNPMRPWTARILELVDQGITHREDIVERAAPWVPVGHAYRVREGHRRHQLRRRSGEEDTPPRRELTMAEIHRLGARVVIVKAVGALTVTGTLVREGDHYRRPDHGR